MIAFILRIAQGAAFALAEIAFGGGIPEQRLAFMIGFSFDPRHFWRFL